LIITGAADVLGNSTRPSIVAWANNDSEASPIIAAKINEQRNLM
jgi:hypothetical protein